MGKTLLKILYWVTLFQCFDKVGLRILFNLPCYKMTLADQYTDYLTEN